MAAAYRDTFTNTMVKDFGRGVVAFKQDESVTWSLEALIGMQLAHAKQQAETYGGELVAGAVITVPPYFSHFERQVILDAAEIAGIKVFSLMNDETAGTFVFFLLHGYIMVL
jgi:hypoxia up-regulated 1